MGSVFKRVKKTIKKVTKPISKVTKGIAKGIAKVAKGVMRGVAKLNKKLGPIGMIAMSFAMPYAMQGLGAGFTKLQAANATNPFGGFLKAVSDIGGNMRTGWTSFKTGFSDKISGISNGIKKMFGDMGTGDNIFGRISRGAKELFKNIKEGMPKFRAGTKGSVQVDGMGYGFGETTSMTSEQALKAIKSGQINPSQLSKQTLGSAEGFFTKAGSSEADKFITDAINKTYESKINALTGNTKKYYDDVLQFAKDSGTFTNKGEIYNHVINSGGTQAQYMDFTDDIIGYTTDLTKTGDYTKTFERIRTGTPVENYSFNGSKTFNKESLEPNKFKNVLKNKTSKKLITAVGDTLLKKSDMPEIPQYDLISTQGATSNDGNYSALTSSAVVQGSTGTDFFRKKFGDEAWQKLKSTVNHMGYQGSSYGI